MATIAANTSAQVALTAGNFIQGAGAGVAQVGSGARGADPLTAGDPWQIGPFERDETIHITAYSGITYEAEQPLSLPSPADRLSAAEVAAIQASVSGAPVAYTFAEAKAAAATASVGASYWVTDVGGGSHWVKSVGGTLRPINGRVVIDDVAVGGVSFPAGLNVARLALQSKIPAGMLQNGFYLHIDPLVSKVGQVDTYTIGVYLGTVVGTIGTLISQSATSVIQSGVTNQRMDAQAQFRWQRISATVLANGVTGSLSMPHASGVLYNAANWPTVPNLDTTDTWLQVVLTGTIGTAGTDVPALNMCPVTIIAHPAS